MRNSFVLLASLSLVIGLDPRYAPVEAASPASSVPAVSEGTVTVTVVDIKGNVVAGRVSHARQRAGSLTTNGTSDDERRWGRDAPLRARPIPTLRRWRRGSVGPRLLSHRCGPRVHREGNRPRADAVVNKTVQ